MAATSKCIDGLFSTELVHVPITCLDCLALENGCVDISMIVLSWFCRLLPPAHLLAYGGPLSCVCSPRSQVHHPVGGAGNPEHAAGRIPTPGGGTLAGSPSISHPLKTDLERLT